MTTLPMLSKKPEVIFSKSENEQMAKVNKGYQSDDARIVDYGLWTLPGTESLIRGPLREALPERYFVAIGGAHTFGRFVQHPYTDRLEAAWGLPGLNLGFSGAGPSFFFQRPDLMRVINRAEVVIVQMMSGRSVENSVFELGVNHGLCRRRASDGPFRFAEICYGELMEEFTPEMLVGFRCEIRRRYCDEMIHLLQSIRRPKILLYMSDREAEYGDGIANIQSYWGGFPHFVNEAVIAETEPYADVVVRSVSRRGLPQPLFDRVTREPVVLWDEKRFPHVRLRDHNHYYPSPEMHEDTFAALRRVSWRETRTPRMRPAEGRPFLFHLHIFKNAGTTVDGALVAYFGEAWINWALESDTDLAFGPDLSSLIASRPGLRAASCHQFRPPFQFDPGISVFPIVFLRHPIDRAASMYRFERLPGRQATSGAEYTRNAAVLSLGQYVEWALSDKGLRFTYSNYQVLVLSLAQTLRRTHRWTDLPAPGLRELGEAIRTLRSLPVVGVVDEYSRSAHRFGEWLAPVFPGLSLISETRNASARPGASLQERLEDIRRELGEKTYWRLVEANALDLCLYREAKSWL